MNFWAGVLVGIVVSAVGFSGILTILDRGVAVVQTPATQLAE